MPFKARTESIELKILRILDLQMNLTVDEQKYYLNLEKGFEGEVQFDLLTEKLQGECFILNDLLLEINNTKFQIDTLIIYQETIYLFEVKNYKGDFCYEPDSFRTIYGKEIKNPLDQLKRSKSLLRQLIQNLGYNLPIEAYVVFINPEFTLYQAPQDQPFIFPTQLNRFMKKLDMTPSKLNRKHKKLADQLVSLHISESPCTGLPTYEYKQLKKGLTCKVCHSFSMSVQGKKLVCDVCGCEEEVESAFLRSVEEFKLLFPDQKITTNVIHDWCKVIKSKKRISRILGKNFKMKGVRQWAFYE
ncbi:NERD domain-containing protein [Neobacillus pocheonensis]|uniref:NERD domain-containing protein n=1 Tax=Neobacillus pocheonensis TaxID=363869 RepID=A0ABT0WI82_9BACI|nr:NERD domain-containing protein [Neobacillus pocheonensis]